MKKLSSLIHLSKIKHRGETRIKVVFPKEQILIDKIKSINGRKWSKTKNCWHVPYNKDSFDSIEKVFGKEQIHYLNKNNVSVKGKIQPQIKEYPLLGEIRKKYTGEKILIQQLNNEWIKVFVPHDKKGWSEVIRNIQGRKWDMDNVCWIVPNVKTSFNSIKNFIGLKNVILDLNVRKDIPDEYFSPKKNASSAKRKKTTGWEKLNDLQKDAIHNTKEYLLLKQYSPTTIKAYLNHLISIFIFHDKKTPQQIENKEIQMYLLHQIKYKKISESTQNVIINAYKLYVEKILGRPRTFVEIPRPKKPKKLPKVISKEEVIDLIEAVDNLKHKLILLLIYSSGLRLGEIVNLRLRDINIKRRNIFILRGKGKKDRYVLLASSVIPFFQTYKKQYAPVYWLFEGKSGGQYSTRSVQSVFTKAKEKSNIMPFATVHTLRHSYATHCVENGFSIKLIQEALGHQSIKTTEVYLHVAGKHLTQLSSPIDGLEINKDSLS